ncbi:MAG: DnaJ domain-containing protein [Sphingomicrobium sp.]
MTPDHYATMGLAPTSQEVVIRAAYVALMRLYHPDRNPSAEAAAHTRAINDAYAVLGDPERRAEYDKMRMEAAWVPDQPPKARSPSALFAAAAITLLALAVFLFVRAPLPSPEQPFGASNEEVSAAEPGALPLSFDPQAVFRSATRQQKEQRPELPLPPPMARVASRPAPVAPVSPVIRPSIVPVLAQSRPAPPQPTTPPPRPRIEVPAVAPAPQPSFSCNFARTRGEITVCNHTYLAALDRQQAILYSESWGRADSATRAKLLRSHGQFIARRDNCRSESCTHGVYLSRLRQISSIMKSR